MAQTPKWQYQKSQELKYARQLRKVAEHSGAIVQAHLDANGELEDIEEMMRSAELYAEALTPWANRVAAAMINNVAKVNSKYWQDYADKISMNIRELLNTSRIAPTIAQLQLQQVTLIKSIPTDAASRAQKLASEAVAGGQRADEVAAMLKDTTDVTKSRANLIARTEIAKTNANITQARAGLVGANQYIWRTMEDGAVRPSHAAMDGQVFRFDDPPEVEGEGNHGPGEFPNCFPGSVYVNNTSFINKLYRRIYSGKLVSLVLDNGVILPATPNHPILTDRGFSPIDGINVGDYVVGISNQSIDMIKPNVNNMHVTFEQMFNALNMLPIFKRSTSVGGQFHGDITDQEVDIISVDSVLIMKIYASVQEKMLKLKFTDADTSISKFILIGDRGGCELLKTSYSSPGSLMSCINLIRHLLGRHFSPLELFCFALGSELDRIQQMSSNGPAINPVMFSDCIFAYSTFIHGFDFFSREFYSIKACRSTMQDCDTHCPQLFAKYSSVDTKFVSNILQEPTGTNQVFRVKDKLITDFSGHVYNLETKTGYYHAENVLSSNCRCYAEVIV